MGRIVNFIETILDYLPEVCLIMVIALSFLPFIFHPHNFRLYATAGGLLAFYAAVLAPEYHSKGSVLYNSLLAAIAMLGVTCMIFPISWKVALCAAATYYGAISGAVCGFVFRKFKH
jgi:hypothetical protein